MACGLKGPGTIMKYKSDNTSGSTEQLPDEFQWSLKAWSKLLAVVPQSERRGSIGLFSLILSVALIETIGVGSILPFVAVAANPSSLHKGFLGTLYSVSGFSNENRFLLLLGITVLLIIVIGNALRALATWHTHRFSQLTGHALAVTLLRAYLFRSYEYFLTRHSADLGKNILHEVHQVVNGVVFPVMSALSRIVMAVLIVALLFITDPGLTIVVILTLGSAYGVMYLLTRPLQMHLGEKHVTSNQDRYYIASEVFAGIKDIKLKGLEEISIRRYSAPSLTYSHGIALSMSLSQVPRFFLETIAFGGVIAMILYLLLVRGGITDVLPLVSLYVFAGYRLLPALQEIFSSVTRIRFSWPSLELVYRDLNVDAQSRASLPSLTPLPFTKAIHLDHVSYKYPLGDREVFRDVSLEIPHGARIGFIGSTGSGKSTAVDLILGLLRPAEGRIFIDDTPLDNEKSIRRWQACIGYVPQHIFLADDTISANIAFGAEGKEIDHTAVERAAQMAQLHEFIVKELPEGYGTTVGERGIRLSGGQRQRLGLARALYGNPSVLVLDEATSALDNETELQVMDALERIGREVTIILIAHRLSTLKGADFIFRIENGAVVSVGSRDHPSMTEKSGNEFNATLYSAR
jgi:ATP-binding cassette, subfamily B, bacterial PglK